MPNFLQATSNWLDCNGEGTLVLEHEVNEIHFAAKRTYVINNKSNVFNKVHESDNSV